MEGLQIIEPKKISTITTTETPQFEDSVKVMITKALFMREDFNTYLGENKCSYPIIPSMICVGKISEVSQDGDDGLERGVRVFPHPITSCGECDECQNGNTEKCLHLNIAGKTTDGFLKDFASIKKNNLTELPQFISDNESLFLEHIALCDSIIDSIKLQRGEHVVIVGGDALGIILAQLVIYYQGVPILIDDNEYNLNLAKNAGVYYTLLADNKVEKHVNELTGGRLSSKVVYMTGSNLGTDIPLKLASQNGKVCFAGFSAPATKVNLQLALTKGLSFVCIVNGHNNVDTAINLLANKAVNLSIFNLQTFTRQQFMNKIDDLTESLNSNADSSLFVIEMV